MFRTSGVPILLLASASVMAQSFEVASVKPVQLMDLGRYKPLEGGPGSRTPMRISGVTTMRWMLTHAYRLKDSQVSGPAWMETEFFDIAATLTPGTMAEQEMFMWQNLLKERFHLQAHRETRELPAYVLVVGKSGPKLKQSDPAEEAADQDIAHAAEGPPRPAVSMGPDGFPQIPADVKMPGSFVLSLSRGEFLRIKMFCRHQTMAELADGLSEFAGRLVENQTGLQGKYDFTLAFETEPGRPRINSEGQASIPSEGGATLSTAVQEQLGLKLETKKANIEMLVTGSRKCRLRTERNSASGILGNVGSTR
jgi:uncharacterized protein (TIGR03435 family)